MPAEIAQPTRRSKLVSVEDAMKAIHDGMYIAIAGHLFSNKPSHLVRQIAKKRVKNLTVSTSPYASYDIDLLIGAGCIKKTICGNVGFEYLGLAPNYRNVCQKGLIEAALGDEATIIGAYMASVEGIPYHPIGSIKGSDVVKMTTLGKEYIGPYGDKLIAVKALTPEVCIIHAQESDEYGNIRFKGPIYFDIIMAKASKKIIVSVDDLVSNQKVRSEPWKTSIPGFKVDMVVHLPYGCHPCLSTGLYDHDEEHLKDYINRGRQSLSGGDTSPYQEYLRKYVYEPVDIYDYIERVGGFKHMQSLRRLP